jgi:phage terminase large subunit
MFKGMSDMTSDNIKSLDNVDICWVEEASSMTQKTLDTLLPTIRKQNSQIIFTYNRSKMNDPVHVTLATNPAPNTIVQEVNYYDNPFFSKTLNDERLRFKATRAEEDYRHVWLGKPYIEENVLIRGDLLKKSFETYKAQSYKNFLPVMGVDVARSDFDKSVITVRQGDKVISITKYINMRGNELSDEIIRMKQIYNVAFILVDSIGVGASPCDFLEKKGYAFSPINFGAKAQNPKYRNVRAESYVRLRDAMMKGLEIMKDDELWDQLEYIPIDTESEKIKLLSKERIRKKLGYSPDTADSLALTYSVLVNDLTLGNNTLAKRRATQWSGTGW